MAYVSAGGFTAGHVALAVVAACRMTGTDPQSVFGPARGNKRVRLIAAAGLMTALKLKPRDVAGVFQVDATRLAPSMLRSADIGTDGLLTIAEALRTGGLLGEAVPAAASPQVEAAGAHASARKPSPVQTRPDRPADPSPAPKPAPLVPPRPRDIARPRPVATNPVRARAAEGRSAVEKVKPVSDNMVRWSRIYVARGVPVADLADLFGVDVEALADRLKPELARAA